MLEYIVRKIDQKKDIAESQFKKYILNCRPVKRYTILTIMSILFIVIVFLLLNALVLLFVNSIPLEQRISMMQ